ncbi:hypothetical protein Tco_0355034 [Tanacetum coccineum]
MDLENTQNNSLAKLPLLKQGEYDTWRLRIESYIQLQDYALWEIIEEGNSFKPVARTTTNEDGTSTTTIHSPITDEQKILKKNDLKARSILMMTLPSLFAPPSIDLSNSGLKKFKQPGFEGYGVKVNKGASENVSKEVKKTSDAPIIEDWVSDCDEDETVVLESLNVKKSKQADQPRKKEFCSNSSLTKSGLVPFSTARQSFSRTTTPVSVARSFKTAAPKLSVNVRKQNTNDFQKSHSPLRIPFYQQTTFKNRNLNNKVNTVKANSVNTVKGKRMTSAVGKQGINAVKPTTYWAWRPKIKMINHVYKNTGSSLAIPGQTTTGKESSNPFMAGSLPKTINANNIDKESQAPIMISDAKEYLISEDPVKQGRMERYIFEEVYRKIMLGANTVRLLINFSFIKMENLEFYGKHNIVNWEYILLGMTEAKDSEVCKFTRADGSSRFHGDIQALLRRLDRQDLRQLYSLVQERFKDHPLEGHDLDLWGDLRMLFDPNEEDDIWLNQQYWELLRWKLHEYSGVYYLFLDGTSIQINMLVERKYPLKKEILEKMINLKIEAEEESTMAHELIKFIKSQIAEQS